MWLKSVPVARDFHRAAMPIAMAELLATPGFRILGWAVEIALPNWELARDRFRGTMQRPVAGDCKRVSLGWKTPLGKLPQN